MEIQGGSPVVENLCTSVLAVSTSGVLLPVTRTHFLAWVSLWKEGGREQSCLSLMVCLGSFTVQGRFKTKSVPTMKDLSAPNSHQTQKQRGTLHMPLAQAQCIPASNFFLSGRLLKGCISFSESHVTEGLQKVFKGQGPAAEMGRFFLQGQSLVRDGCQSRSDPCSQELHPLEGRLELSVDPWLLFMDLAVLSLCCRKSNHLCFRNNVFGV